MKFLLLSAMLLLVHLVRAQTVAVDAFASLLNQTKQAQVIDVRTPAEFADGHLPNAVNINSQREDFRQALGELDKTRPVFVYCLSGGRSKAAAEKLRELGYPTVYELQGGYLKWSSKMMPVAGVTPSGDASQWTVARFDSLIRTQPVVLVDVYATWCAPCKKMAPIVDKLTTELAGQVTIIKANADTEKALLAQYQVDELPTLLLFRNGKLANRQIGFCDEAALRGLLKQ
ncbi:thioredoxin domain-containing protein [Fibrella forsythiae]|uniref:Thioredoxin 1 n=1 Tax=Fibrella forsythiae TaxID=2817061 RepID=A0ABS3JQD5_9BACT|nr:thioredoxin domain-containing protein [Fibrella forsythiae]MBO0952208.1 thioredoxin 1 [Fibrella forsythiae]